MGAKVKLQYTLDIAQYLFANDFRKYSPLFACKGRVWCATSEFSSFLLYSKSISGDVRSCFFKYPITVFGECLQQGGIHVDFNHTVMAIFGQDFLIHSIITH